MINRKAEAILTDAILFWAGQSSQGKVADERPFSMRSSSRALVSERRTLAASAVAITNLPPETAKRLQKHPVPVILLGRLAVDQKAKGQGLGKALLCDALRRSLDLSEQLGLFAVEVLAIDGEARDFYTNYDFVPLPDNDLHLFLPISTIEAGRAEKTQGHF
jgi:predicted GNAT family N-acyltransferase